MKMRTIKHFLAACFLLVFATSIHAQEQGTKTYLPKFAIKTNALYWATSTPNLGFEVALAKKLTLDVSGNYNPWKFSKDRQIKHWLVQPELRYWLCERFNGSFFGLHGHYADVNMSNLDIFGLGNYRYDGKIDLWCRYLLRLPLDTEKPLEYGSHYRCRICPPGL